MCAYVCTSDQCQDDLIVHLDNSVDEFFNHLRAHIPEIYSGEQDVASMEVAKTGSNVTQSTGVGQT